MSPHDPLVVCHFYDKQLPNGNALQSLWSGMLEFFLKIISVSKFSFQWNGSALQTQFTVKLSNVSSALSPTPCLHPPPPPPAFSPGLACNTFSFHTFLFSPPHPRTCKPLSWAVCHVSTPYPFLCASLHVCVLSRWGKSNVLFTLSEVWLCWVGVVLPCSHPPRLVHGCMGVWHLRPKHRLCHTLLRPPSTWNQKVLLYTAELHPASSSAIRLRSRKARLSTMCMTSLKVNVLSWTGVIQIKQELL